MKNRHINPGQYRKLRPAELDKRGFSPKSEKYIGPRGKIVSKRVFQQSKLGKTLEARGKEREAAGLKRTQKPRTGIIQAIENTWNTVKQGVKGALDAIAKTFGTTAKTARKYAEPAGIKVEKRRGKYVYTPPSDTPPFEVFIPGTPGSYASVPVDSHELPRLQRFQREFWWAKTGGPESLKRFYSKYKNGLTFIGLDGRKYHIPANKIEECLKVAKATTGTASLIDDRAYRNWKKRMLGRAA